MGTKLESGASRTKLDDLYFVKLVGIMRLQEGSVGSCIRGNCGKGIFLLLLLSFSLLEEIVVKMFLDRK